MLRYTRPMQTHEIIKVQIEKLVDGSIAVRAHSEATSRVLLDRCFIVKGGFEHGVIHITPEGINWELS